LCHRPHGEILESCVLNIKPAALVSVEASDQACQGGFAAMTAGKPTRLMNLIVAKFIYEQNVPSRKKMYDFIRIIEFSVLNMQKSI
jgi:hypothetical protein